MKFETKYNLGDKVWYMRNNRPVEVAIAGVRIESLNNVDIRVYYDVQFIHSTGCVAGEFLPEDRYFNTIDELFDSLR